MILYISSHALPPKFSFQGVECSGSSPDDLCNYGICVTMYELELVELVLCKLQGYWLLLFISKYCQYWGKMYYLCLHVILILYFYRTYLVFVEYTMLWSSCWGAVGMLMNRCVESVWLSHLLCVVVCVMSKW